jgi:hypothetical protein
VSVVPVAGVPESVLAAEDAARLPAAAPPAPWQARLRAVVWWHRAAPGAVQHLPEGLRGRHLPLTVGAMVRYLDTPVGPYSEVLASPVVVVRRGLPAASIPFIAVDSLASVLGGRANWALPKTMARFAWSGPAACTGEGDGWRVAAAARPRGPRVPVLAPARDVQLGPDGRRLEVPIGVRALVRAAQVDVRTLGPTLPQWLRPGAHPGVVVERARMRFGAPRE